MIGSTLQENETFGDSYPFPAELFDYQQLEDGAIVLYIIGLICVFFALGLVTYHFFLPSIDVFIEKFDISPEVSGAILLPAAWALPELITSVIGVLVSMREVSIGTIVGSSVANVIFAIVTCAFACSKPCSLKAWPLIRDMLFFAVSIILLGLFSVDSQLEWWEGLILLIWYVMFILYMVFRKKIESVCGSCCEKVEKNEDGSENVEEKIEFQFNPNKKPVFEVLCCKTDDTAAEIEPQTTQQETSAIERFSSKLIWILSLPFILPMWIITPDPKIRIFKNLFPITFIVSIGWIIGFSYLMVWWASTIGFVLGIPTSTLGITVLALGSHIPLIIAVVLMSRQGHGDVAVSFSLGSNIFNATVILPIPAILNKIIFQQDTFVNSWGMGCSIGLLFIILLLVLLVILIFRGSMTKFMGVIQGILYGLFVVISLLFEYNLISCPI